MKNGLNGGTHASFALIPDEEWEAWRAYKRKANSAAGLRKLQYGLAKSREYLDAVHSYTLFRGDSSLGRTVEMTGREAKKINDEWIQKFINNKTPRLYRWKFNRPASID